MGGGIGVEVFDCIVVGGEGGGMGVNIGGMEVDVFDCSIGDGGGGGGARLTDPTTTAKV